jgi:hypothetical protein
MAVIDAFASTTVFTVPDIAAGRIKALVVLRQAGTGVWYVLPTSLAPPRDAEVMITMGQLMASDPSLAALVQMKPGLGARRPKPTARWQAFSLAKPERQPARAVLVGDGHDQRQQTCERRQAFFANQASLWLILLGTVLGLAAALAFIDPPRLPAVAGVTGGQVLGTGLVLATAWLLGCGFAAGASGRARWAVAGALLPTLAGGLPLLWGHGWLGLAPPGPGPTWFGFDLLRLATGYAGLALAALALWICCCALGMWWAGRGETAAADERDRSAA